MRISRDLLSLVSRDSLPCRHVKVPPGLSWLYQHTSWFSVDSRNDKIENAVRKHLDGLQMRHDALVASLGDPGVSQQDMTVMSKEIAGLSSLVQAKTSMDRISKEMEWNLLRDMTLTVPNEGFSLVHRL